MFYMLREHKASSLEKAFPPSASTVKVTEIMPTYSTSLGYWKALSCMRDILRSVRHLELPSVSSVGPRI